MTTVPTVGETVGTRDGEEVGSGEIVDVPRTGTSKRSEGKHAKSPKNTAILDHSCIAI